MKNCNGCNQKEIFIYIKSKKQFDGNYLYISICIYCNRLVNGKNDIYYDYDKDSFKEISKEEYIMSEVLE